MFHVKISHKHGNAFTLVEALNEDHAFSILESDAEEYNGWLKLNQEGTVIRIKWESVDYIEILDFDSFDSEEEFVAQVF